MAKKKTEKKKVAEAISVLPNESQALSMSLQSDVELLRCRTNLLEVRIDRIVEAHEKCKSLRNL